MVVTPGRWPVSTKFCIWASSFFRPSAEKPTLSGAAGAMAGVLDAAPKGAARVAVEPPPSSVAASAAAMNFRNAKAPSPNRCLTRP